MASLSLVIAAFSQNVAPDAVPYAVGGATAFLAAVVLTILHEVRRSARAVVHIEIGSATIVAIVAGLALLGIVIAEFAFVPRFEVALRIIGMILGIITLVAFGTLALRMHEAVDRLRGDPAEWPRRGGSSLRRLSSCSSSVSALCRGSSESGSSRRSWPLHPCNERIGRS